MFTIKCEKQAFSRFFVVILSLFVPCLVAMISTSLQAQVIHAIVVVDQDTRAKLGRNAKADFDNIIWLLQSNIPSAQLNLRALEVYRINPGSILQELQSLRVAPNDTVLFYYSGHGAYDPQRQEQYLEMKDRGNLYRSKVIETIESKSPRLSVILTDCCNVKAIPEKYIPRTENKVAKIPSVMSPLFETLFVSYMGRVDITSSQLGEYSFVDTSGQFRGSCFTYPLVELLAANKINDDMNWDTFLTKLRPQVNEAFQESFPKGYQGQTRQSVHVYSMPRRIYTQVSTTPVSSRQDVPTGPRLGIRAINHQQPGVRITGIIPNSPASKIGFQEGDIIIAINGQKITNEREYSDAVDASSQNMIIKIQRQGISTPITYPVELAW